MLKKEDLKLTLFQRIQNLSPEEGSALDAELLQMKEAETRSLNARQPARDDNTPALREVRQLRERWNRLETRRKSTTTKAVKPKAKPTVKRKVGDDTNILRSKLIRLERQFSK